jgi:hypothetical protein
MKQLTLLFAVFLTHPACSQGIMDPLHRYDVDFKTGIRVGQKIPPFQAVDQNGKTWDFDSIKGPQGAVILFHRSADW